MSDLTVAAAGAQVLSLPLEHVLDPPAEHNSRTSLGDLDELVESICAYGVLEPVDVRPASAGRYTLIFGSRRVAAARLAGLTHIPAVLRDDADQDVLVLSVIENLQRRGLSGPECVRALRLLAAQPGSSREIARRAGVNKLRVQLWRKIESQPLLLEAVETNRIPLWLACRCAYVKPERLPQVLSEVERLPTRLAEERVTAVLREQRDHRPARGMFKHSAAPPARGVEALLIEALELLRQVRLIRTSTELGLVRDVIKLAERWQASMKEATASRPTRWSCGSCGTEITTLPRAGKQVCPKCSSTWWTPVATRAVEARAI